MTLNLRTARQRPVRKPPMRTNDVDELEIAPEDVESLLAKKDPALQLVDVREDWELSRGVLPHAVHIPLSQFAKRQDHWDEDKRYVVYCEHGIRSLDVVVWLANNKGITAKSMRGGFAEWHGEVKTHDGDSGRL